MLKLELLEMEGSELFEIVKEDILKNGNSDYEIENYIKDVLKHGSISRVVSSLIYSKDTVTSNLIYSKDTKEFFIKHMDEIFKIYNEFISDIPFMPFINADDLSWFAYETVVRDIANRLSLDV